MNTSSKNQHYNLPSTPVRSFKSVCSLEGDESSHSEDGAAVVVVLVVVVDVLKNERTDWTMWSHTVPQAQQVLVVSCMTSLFEDG